METMTIPTTPWASLPSYAPSFAGPADCAVAVTVALTGGADFVFGTDGDAAPTAQVDAGLVRHTVLERNKDIRTKDISTKDIRPGSRAWSPPV